MEQTRQVDNVDVVVVGSGIAGLCAAASAREAGARVSVIERADAEEFGGNTRYTEAFMRMKSVDEVADDLVDMLSGDFMGYPEPGALMDTLQPRSRWSGATRMLNVVDHEVISTLADSAGDTLSWLMSFGVRIEALPTYFPTTSTTRIAPIGGGLALIEALRDGCERLSVDFRYQCTASCLVVREGRVVGVEIVDGAGRETIEGSVVLACGGYEGNPEMLTRYHGASGLFTRPVAKGGYFNRGEGIEMGLAVGAASSGNFGLFHAEPVDPRSPQAEAVIFAFPYGILVNAEGMRFVDEAPGPVDAWYERITRRIHSQPQGIAYAILDAPAHGLKQASIGIRSDRAPIVADDLPSLARELDVPGDQLCDTVREYNDACPGGGAGSFDPARPDGLRTVGLRPGKSNWAMPLVDGPFYAYPIIAANTFTFGGLRTNAKAQVLNGDGGCIPGLFAAGEMTGMYFTNYTGATSVLRGAVFGRIAGRECVAMSEKNA